MRHFTKLALGLALSSVMAFSASAEIIDSDWLNEGDGLTFTDTDTGLEFLDLTETLDMSISEVGSLLDTTYAGWAFAAADQVVTMLTNLLADTEVQYNPSSGTRVNTAISSRDEIFDIVEGYDTGDLYYLYGLASNGDISMYGIRLASTYTTLYYNNSAYADTYSLFAYGVWLVRDSSASSLTDVPAPLALSSLALLGLGLTRRKKIA